MAAWWTNTDGAWRGALMDLFVYGTLMVAEVMHRVCGHTGRPQSAVLRDYRRWRLRGEVYPAIVPDVRGQVEGLLHRGLQPAQIAALDAFEGDFYRRMAVEVQVGARSCPAETYVLDPAFTHLLSTEEWSLQAFAERAKGRFLTDYAGFRAISVDDERR